MLKNEGEMQDGATTEATTVVDDEAEEVTPSSLSLTTDITDTRDITGTDDLNDLTATVDMTGGITEAGSRTEMDVLTPTHDGCN